VHSWKEISPVSALSLVLAALAVMAVLGAVFGLGLAIAAKRFHVEMDPRVEQVDDALPGINCGACGYAGCEAYAEAVVKEGAPPNMCIPGGHDTAIAVARIMGLDIEPPAEPFRAVVHCQGSPDKCRQVFEYDGIENCQAAHLIQSGLKACGNGCLGLGTCVTACPFDAIVMGEDRLPGIDWDKCTGCGACVRACPRDLCQLVPMSANVYVACSNQDKAKDAKAACSVACITCWLCVKKSPEGAVDKVGNVPRLTRPEGVEYAEAIEKCPMNCFVQIERATAVALQTAAASS